MKKFSSFFVFIIVVFASFSVFYFIPLKFNQSSLPNLTYGAEIEESGQQNLSESSPVEPTFIKPWSKLEVNTSKIVIYPDRVEPSENLTFTYTFGNEGTDSIKNVIIKFLPPNIIVPFASKPLSYWVEQVSKFPMEISDPTFSPVNAENRITLLDTIRWNVATIPPKGAGTDTFRIVFKLKVAVDSIKISQDLQCWIGMFNADAQKEPPLTYKAVDIEAEVKPEFEFYKFVLHPQILPGETNVITIRFRNNSKMPADDVTIFEDASELSAVHQNFIELDPANQPNPNPRPDTLDFPKMVWTNIELEPEMNTWETYTFTVQAKSYNEIKTALSEGSIHIGDIASLWLGNEPFDSVTAAFSIVAPDLAATELVPKIFGTQASPNFPIFVYAEIANVGYSTISDTFMVRLLIDGKITTYEKQITDTVRVGDSIPLSWLIDPLSEESHTLTIIVDTDSTVKEVDETNNTRDTTFVVGFESYNVEVNRVTHKDGVPIGGEKALFPKPILSQIMVIDTNFHYLSGLADSLTSVKDSIHWSLPNDEVFANRLPLSDLWSVLTEVDETDSSKTADSVVTDYKLTRISSALDDTISIAFVLDTGLPTELFNIMKDSVKVFINTKRPSDKIALITFDSQLRGSQTLLLDKTQLMGEIDALSQGSETGQVLFAAVDTAINLLKAPAVNGRKMVFVCTNNSLANTTELDTLIKHAHRDDEAVPIFVFTITHFERDDLLLQLAENTGGVMMSELGGDLHKFMAYDLSLFHEMFQNYYILSYATPDPRENGRWRRLRVELNNLSTEQEFDTGRYKAPKSGIDLRINKELKSGADSSEGDTLYYGSIEDNFTFTLSYQNNNNTLPAIETVIRDTILTLNKYVRLVPSDPQPEVNGNILEWKLGDLEPNASGEITYTISTLPESMLVGGVTLENRVGIHQANAMDEDANLADNYDNVKIHIPLELPQITVTPTVINPGDSIEHVFVTTKWPLYPWDILVTLADGTPAKLTLIIDPNEPIPPGTTDVGYLEPQYTTKRTKEKEEKITFELIAQYYNYPNQKKFNVKTFAIVKSELKFFLDQNVYKPAQGEPLKYHYSIPGPLTVKIKVYNIAGEQVKELVNEYHSEGKAYFKQWDGVDRHGHQLGSGVYIFVFEAEGDPIIKKLAVIR